MFIAHVYPTDPERYWACYLSPLKFLKCIPILGLPAPPRALAAPCPLRHDGAGRQVGKYYPVPVLHVCMLLPAATLRRYLQQAEPSILWNPTPRVQRRPNPPRTGRGRPAADSIVEHAADAANLGGGGRARARAGRSGCVIVGWRGAARSELWNCTMCKAERSVLGERASFGRLPGVRCNCVYFV